MSDEAKPAARWLVDGMNVIGSRPDGWWRDRRGAMRRLVERLGDYAAETGEEVTVVFDGKPFSLTGDEERSLRVVFAPRSGRNAADHEIAEMVAADPDPGALRVVTSDTELAGRVGALGAEVVGSRAFRRRLD